MEREQLRNAIYMAISRTAHVSLKDLSDETKFSDFPVWDSLDFMCVASDVENELGVKLPDQEEDLMQSETIGELVSKVCECFHV